MRKRVAFVGGSGAFQPEIAYQNPDSYRDKSFWILLASKVSGEIKKHFSFFFLDQKESGHNIRWMFEPAGGRLKAKGVILLISSISFFLEEKRNKKIKAKRSLPALPIFMICKPKNTKGFSDKSIIIEIHSSSAPLPMAIGIARPTPMS